MPIPVGEENGLELAASLEIPDEERLSQAQALVRSYCRWHIAPERTETLTVRGSGSHVLVLPTLRVGDVTALTDDGVAVDLDDVDWSEDGWIRRLSCRWSRSRVTVTLRHGFPSVPADVTGVVQALAQRAKVNPGLASRSTGPFSESYTTEFLATERLTLDRYKIPPRP